MDYRVVKSNFKVGRKEFFQGLLLLLDTMYNQNEVESILYSQSQDIFAAHLDVFLI